ncbi:MAG TPA: glucoamylase family protein [Terracidiphilus sp.]|nr:glucoamylase family protein [Terracidiphilus sp.]
MTDTVTVPEMPPPIENAVLERLRIAAKAAMSWDVIHRPASPSNFPERLDATRKAVRKLRAELNRLSDVRNSGGGSSLQELRSNSRLFRAAMKSMSTKPEELAALPRVVLPTKKDEPRVATVAASFLRAVDGVFSIEAFSAFIQALQENEPLELEELWSTAAFLNFVLMELLLDRAWALLRSPEPVYDPAISPLLTSLVAISDSDWTSIIEPLIVFDAVLRLDPAGTYPAMDLESRNQYRKRVAYVARHSDYSEAKVAQAALDLALEGASHPVEDPRIQRRRSHVGFYLIDQGFSRLAERVEFHPRLIDRARRFIRDHADDFYISGTQLITILFIAAIIFPIVTRIGSFGSLIAVIAFVLLPVTQCAVDLVNNSVTAVFDPEALPKLDFSKGVPAECTTLVAVPALLLKEAQVRELVTDLEVRFLANRDPHIHFALLTDLPDSVVKPHKNDAHPLVELAVHLIDELNSKYSSTRNGGFVLLHRHRIFNVRQGVWMGWERKRGKLLDLNKLLVGDFDAFPIKAGRIEVLKQVRYVLTLDSDTQLPRKSAAKLIATLAHPLNQAVIDPHRRVVVAGYGILQPRVGVSVSSAARSRMAAIYSGQTGFDIYTRAISDAYQDLYGEGSFTGKGIYEVETFHSVLNARFPRNSLLSHDLIEGAYARAGLATDIELIDDYPSHWSAYSRRKHRWVRGDWQIAQWLFSRVPGGSGRWTTNPISTISRWKILDNLRRSLVEPAAMVLFVAGWLGLPGGPLYWTIASLILLEFPAIVQFAFSFGQTLGGGHKERLSEVFSGFRQSTLVALVNLIFLPHQTLLAIDAIVRALVRQFITGARLLEWETAAQAESRSNRRAQVDRYLGLTPLVAIGIAAAVYFLRPRSDAILIAAPVLALWASAILVTHWLDASPNGHRADLDDAEEEFLLEHALRIWRYFSQFGGERHNYLVPDHVEEDGLFEAARISPTNIGLLLNARQAACEFGFLTPPEFAALTERTLATIDRLEKFRGHLYNWYDTQTLRSVTSDPFVSSVDSGNFVASLYTLHAGALELLLKPLLSAHGMTGLRAHWELMRSGKKLPRALGRIAPPGQRATSREWIAWILSARRVLSEYEPETEPKSGNGDRWWFHEMQSRVNAIHDLLVNYMPWLLPEYAPLMELPELAVKPQAHKLSVDDASVFAGALETSLAGGKISSDASLAALGKELLASLPAALKNLRGLAAAIRGIARNAERLADETDFSFLADPTRQILSIGYDVRAKKLHGSCYDLIASEARVATFLSVARDELPQQSWIKLGREHTYAFGRYLLFSWTGTMFEYLMPALWMRSYPETLIAQTLTSCVQVQREFARSIRVPWGISESGHAQKDDAGHYRYQAFGVPQVALFVDADAGPVISPYSSFLALGVDSVTALHNLKEMASEKWVGAYGFYEAADYSVSRGKPVLVREWMAHHQGMSLLSILNLLHDDVVQKWFHANPLVQSAELLLHETPMSEGVLRAKLRE